MNTNENATRQAKQWSEDMGEISGFGGGYEAMCRKMVLAGIAWLDENPDADPQFSGFTNVFGLVMESNDDAKALTAAMTATADDCTRGHAPCQRSALSRVQAAGLGRVLQAASRAFGVMRCLTYSPITNRNQPDPTAA